MDFTNQKVFNFAPLFDYLKRQKPEMQIGDPIAEWIKDPVVLGMFENDLVKNVKNMDYKKAVEEKKMIKDVLCLFDNYFEMLYEEITNHVDSIKPKELSQTEIKSPYQLFIAEEIKKYKEKYPGKTDAEYMKFFADDWTKFQEFNSKNPPNLPKPTKKSTKSTKSSKSTKSTKKPSKPMAIKKDDEEESDNDTDNENKSISRENRSNSESETDSESEADTSDDESSKTKTDSESEADTSDDESSKTKTKSDYRLFLEREIKKSRNQRPGRPNTNYLSMAEKEWKKLHPDPVPKLNPEYVTQSVFGMNAKHDSDSDMDSD